MLSDQSIVASWVRGVALLAVAGFLAEPLVAQDMEEITVTARKREESLQEIPLAITAVTADTIDRAGFKGLEELSLSVAGLQYHDQGGQRPGRLNPAIRFRGMNVNSNIPTFQLGALFVDGVYVLGSTHSIPLDDLERVEVIKGPQAAYFGRNTFGGAVNYITKNPSLEEYEGKLQVSAADYEEYDVSISHSGPLGSSKKVAYRLGARFYDKGNMWTASDGGGMGEQSTNTLNATLFAEPTDKLTIRLRAFYGKDEDGPPAGGFIGGEENSSCQGQTITTAAGEQVVPVNWFCNGFVPEPGAAISRIGDTNIINTVTTIAPAIESQLGVQGLLRQTVLNSPLPAAVADVPSVEGIEMERETTRYSAFVSYEFDNGMSLDFQAGFNDMKVNWVRDQGLSAIAQNIGRDPQAQEDASYELRLASNQEGKLRWLAGVNIYEQDFATSGTGGRVVVYCWDTLPNQPANGAGCAPIPPLVTGDTLPNTDRVETTGWFGAVSYDFTDQFQLSLEGRMQSDELKKAGVVISSDTFLPRVIFSYQPFDQTNLYASWSQGVLPGEANPFVIGGDTQELAQYRAQFPRIEAITSEELLDSYEIGWKQELWEGRANFAAALYWGTWDNQKSRVVAVIQETCDSGNGASAGCRPQDQVGAGDTGACAGIACLADGTPIFTPRNTTVAGTGDIWGVELEGGVAFTDRWNANFSLAMAESEFTDFEANFIQSFANFTNVNGNRHARYPKWTGSLSTTYTAPARGDWEWFVRGDAYYFGETYASVANIATCSDYWLVNGRLGMEKNNVRVELWGKNLLDDDNWSACARWTDFTRPIDFQFFTYFQGVAVSPQNRRQFGIKVSLDF